jgi:hypothetical protein
MCLPRIDSILFQATWKDSQKDFIMNIQWLEATAKVADPGMAYRVLFDILHLKRLMTNMDTYGHGRSFSNIEPVFVMTFTCTGPLLTAEGLSNKVNKWLSE